MILDSLDQAHRYIPLHPGFEAAFAFLREQAPETLEDGEVAIDGDRVFAIIARSEGRGRAASPLEAHRRYIDIQVVVEGHDLMGWRELATCHQAKAPFDPDRDIVFFNEEPQAWFEVPHGFFTIFFPEDAHAPLAGSSPVRKIVIKVEV